MRGPIVVLGLLPSASYPSRTVAPEGKVVGEVRVCRAFLPSCSSGRRASLPALARATYVRGCCWRYVGGVLMFLVGFVALRLFICWGVVYVRIWVFNWALVFSYLKNRIYNL